MKSATTGMIFTVMLPGVAVARAQTDKPSRRVTLDFHAGAFWEKQKALDGRTTTHPWFGLLFSPYLGREGMLRRVSIQFGFDFVPIRSSEFFDPDLGRFGRVSDQFLSINPALAFDVVQTSHVDVTLRYGGAPVVSFTTIELETLTGEFRDVCDVEPFSGLCPADWSFLGNAGATLRIYPRRDSGFHFGVDYTRFAGRLNQLVGVIGVTF